MALTFNDLQALFECVKDVHFPNKGAVTLGTQALNIPHAEMVRLLLQKGVDFCPISREEREELLSVYEESSFGHSNLNILLSMMGFDDIVNIDVIPHTSRAYLHNLGEPLPEEFHGRFGIMVDGCTGHHVFDRVQLFTNIANMLAVGGVAVHTTVLDPMSHNEGPMNLHSLVRFYESNGFSDIRAFLSAPYNKNSIYEFKGDLHGLRRCFEKDSFLLFFYARKVEDVPLDFSFLSWPYDLTRRRKVEEKVDKAVLAGRKVAVWGSMGHYEEFYKDIVADPEGYTVAGIVDGNPDRHGDVLDGHEIVAPARLKEMDVDIVLIASYMKDEILNELIELMHEKPEVLHNTYKLYENTFLRKQDHVIHEDYHVSLNPRLASQVK